MQSRNTRLASTSSINTPSSGRLMSISSIITAPPMYTSSSSTTLKMYHHKESMERRASAPSHPYNYPQRYSSSSTLLRSPPTSPEDKFVFESSTPSSPSSSTSSLSQKRNSYQGKSKDEDIMMDDQIPGQAPLTLQERRLRNKAASAKYRQKKNQQQNEMRLMIGRLSEQNAVLERQLQELRLENQKLKATTDRLRGKMVAKKMLKKWIGRQNGDHHLYSSNDYKNALSAHNETNINAVVATISSDQDEDDELDSIGSE